MCQLGDLRPASHTGFGSSHLTALQTMGGLVSGSLLFRWAVLLSEPHCHLDRQLERGFPHFYLFRAHRIL